MAKKQINTDFDIDQNKPSEINSHEVPEDGIGSRIRSAREARGFSQTAVSIRSKDVDPNRRGIARTVLVGYESGQFKPGAREIRILCETLSITPNWLIFGADVAAQTSHVAMEGMTKYGKGLTAVFRLALAIAVLKPHEKACFSSLVLSMAGRDLGDLKLSGLFMAAEYLAEDASKKLQEFLPKFYDEGDSIETVIAKWAKYQGDGAIGGEGNRLKFDDDGNVVGGEWLYPEPKT